MKLAYFGLGLWTFFLMISQLYMQRYGLVVYAYIFTCLFFWHSFNLTKENKKCSTL